ncbi:hypothetical protein C2I17_12270 [Niallia circulans]|uniref:hypothetical protein n=1 Tax=Niallia circulans TaxID=1397 RepID=UPI00201DF240|nr:hypothetical protein [Niallia circulans]UQZ75246.1 hypothetical protein C2I17_12270 [Niallia circulans]
MKQMELLNPIFNSSNRPKEIPSIKENVQKRSITKEEGRQTRSDKKKDVKIPLSEEERQMVKRVARRKGWSLIMNLLWKIFYGYFTVILYSSISLEI